MSEKLDKTGQYEIGDTAYVLSFEYNPEGWMLRKTLIKSISISVDGVCYNYDDAFFKRKRDDDLISFCSKKQHSDSERNFNSLDKALKILKILLKR